jgi:hypothetical protein
VQLLDLSGCQVSAGTCVVLAEALGSNSALQVLLLQVRMERRALCRRPQGVLVQLLSLFPC